MKISKKTTDKINRLFVNELTEYFLNKKEPLTAKDFTSMFFKVAKEVTKN